MHVDKLEPFLECRLTQTFVHCSCRRLTRGDYNMSSANVPALVLVTLKIRDKVSPNVLRCRRDQNYWLIRIRSVQSVHSKVTSSFNWSKPWVDAAQKV